MVKKTHRIGERATSYFDSLDLEILDALDRPDFIKGFSDELSVLELAKTVGLKHKNLKPHLDKLISLGLILVNTSGDVKLVTPLFLERAIRREDDNDVKKSMEKVVSNYRETKNILKKAQEFFYKRDIKEKIDIDLRKVRNAKDSIGKSELISFRDLIAKK